MEREIVRQTNAKARALWGVCAVATAVTVFLVGDSFAQESWQWYGEHMSTQDVRMQGVVSAFGTAFTAMIAGSLAEESQMTAERERNKGGLDK